MASSWTTQAVAHSRLLRPFPTKKLADVLFHVQQDAGSINQALLAVLVEPPRSVEEWVLALDHLEGLLESLSARCEDAAPALAQMVDRADSDYDRALAAMVAVLRGMSEPEPAQTT